MISNIRARKMRMKSQYGAFPSAFGEYYDALKELFAG